MATIRGGVVVLAAATLALTACSSVVNGSGLAVPLNSPSRSHPGFPSTSEVAPPSSTPTGTLTNGVSVTYAAGHLRATFPSKPEERSDNGSFGGTSFTVHIAIAHDPTPTEAASEDTSDPIVGTEQQTTMRVAVSSFSSSSGFTVTDNRTTTFRGHDGRIATATGPDDTPYTLLVFFWTDTRFYILFGATGPIFTTLSTTFQPLP